MSFNLDPSKQVQELILTRKVKKVVHPPIFFNNKAVQQVSSKKHLGLILETSLTYDENIRAITLKVSKSIGLLRKLNNCLPRSSLITIYKSFGRPHLDYGDVIFDKAYNNSFQQRIESLQYKASLAITGAIKGSSTERLFQKVGVESLQNRRWFRKVSVFYKIVKEQSPKYLYDLIPSNNISYQTRNRLFP